MVLLRARCDLFNSVCDEPYVYTTYSKSYEMSRDCIIVLIYVDIINDFPVKSLYDKLKMWVIVYYTCAMRQRYEYNTSGMRILNCKVDILVLILLSAPLRQTEKTNSSHSPRVPL